MKWLVWVEKEPNTVVVVQSRLALFWKLNGFMGLWASLRGKRMRSWNGWDGSLDPISEARGIEANLKQRKFQ